MPLFMDVHTIEGGVAPVDVAAAHQKDLETQKAYGVDNRRYWVDQKAGKIFCLVEASDAETAMRVTPGGSWPGGRRDLPGRGERLTRPLLSH